MTPLGAEGGHFVKVTLWFSNSFRHTNRLADDIISLNDGRPEHRIELRRA